MGRSLVGDATGAASFPDLDILSSGSSLGVDIDFSSISFFVAETTLGEIWSNLQLNR